MAKVVSYSGEDIYLSYLPEFRAKTESESNPLPYSVVVRSLKEFVGDLKDELLLCPVRALKTYRKRTERIVSHPRTLFVSPRCSFQPLSKNAVSLLPAGGYFPGVFVGSLTLARGQTQST